VYADYQTLLGVVHIGDDGMLKIAGVRPGDGANIRGLVLYYATQLPDKLLTPENVLRLMARKMPDGHRTWCELHDGDDGPEAEGRRADPYVLERYTLDPNTR
jgi:hypothetical protein